LGALLAVIVSRQRLVDGALLKFSPWIDQQLIKLLFCLLIIFPHLFSFFLFFEPPCQLLHCTNFLLYRHIRAAEALSCGDVATLWISRELLRKFFRPGFAFLVSDKLKLVFKILW
jgi:hypothetical protein